MKYILLGLILTMSTYASTYRCQISLNSESEIVSDLDFRDTKQIKIANVDYYQVFLNKNEDQFSIEIFDPSIPSRSYAQGVIDKENILSYTLWLRNILLEIKCLEENV